MNPQSPVLPGHEEMPEVRFAKDQPQYLQLPAVIVPGPEGEVITRWKMTDNEAALLVNGGDIYLSLLTFGQPLQPITLRVATSDMIWSENRNIVVEPPRSPTPADPPIRRIKVEVPPIAPETPRPAPETAIAPITSQSVAHESEPTGQITPPDFIHADGRKLYFSRYKEDGSLRLYPTGSYLNDEPARYSEDPVNVKILVVRTNGSSMAVIPVRRAFLDEPDAEKILAERAWIIGG